MTDYDWGRRGRLWLEFERRSSYRANIKVGSLIKQENAGSLRGHTTLVRLCELQRSWRMITGRSGWVIGRRQRSTRSTPLPRLQNNIFHGEGLRAESAVAPGALFICSSAQDT